MQSNEWEAGAAVIDAPKTVPNADACLSCGGDSRVQETRPGVAGVIRRRICTRCGTRWTTHEVRAAAGHTFAQLPLAIVRETRRNVLALLRHLQRVEEPSAVDPGEEPAAADAELALRGRP